MSASYPKIGFFDRKFEKSIFDPRIGLNRIFYNGDIILRNMNFALYRDLGEPSIFEKKIFWSIFWKNQYKRFFVLKSISQPTIVPAKCPWNFDKRSLSELWETVDFWKKNFDRFLEKSILTIFNIKIDISAQLKCGNIVLKFW